MTILSEAARIRLEALVAQETRMSAAIQRLEHAHVTNAAAYSEINSTLNFRERRLRGAFGGDKKKVARHAELVALLAGLVYDLASERMALQRVQTEITQIIDMQLRLRDTTYMSLARTCDDGEAAMAASKRLITLINRALDEVDDAQDANMLDAIGVDGLAALDYVETDEAHDAITAVNNFLPQYMARMETFLGHKGAGTALHNLDQLLQMLDIVDIGADLGVIDLFQIEELDKAEQALRSHRDKARAAAKQVSALLVPLNQHRKARQDAVRATIG